MSAILVVEDEHRIATFLSRALSACGFDVTCAPNGNEAIERLEREHYDLVLLDLLLPGADGFEVLERTLRARPTQEVLVLSALSDVESKVKCFEFGAADYVTKPFVLAELVARIRTRLRQSQFLTTTRFLDAGGVRLDLQRRTASARGERVSLSTREFHLLEHLMRRGGEVCPREELLATVWGYTFDPHTNVVDVYIRRLRGKLGDDLIETVRNVGYCFAPSS
jgi:two-component system copper resistance phosphate regulon response regulator CusR